MLKRRLNVLPIKLDLGCADRCREGFTGLDIDDYGQDIVWDIIQGLPFPDNSIIEVWCHHTLEHISDRDVWPFFNDLLRVCQNDCILEFHCPESSQDIAYYPDHVSYWNVQRLKGFFKAWEQYPQRFDLIDYKVGADLYFKLKVVKST